MSITMSYHAGRGLRPAMASGQQDVLLGGQRGQQVELLEDEADLLAAQLGQPAVAQAGDLGLADVDLRRS